MAHGWPPIFAVNRLRKRFSQQGVLAGVMPALASAGRLATIFFLNLLHEALQVLALLTSPSPSGVSPAVGCRWPASGSSRRWRRPRTGSRCLSFF
jgi:hypothetical protein